MADWEYGCRLEPRLTLDGPHGCHRAPSQALELASEGKQRARGSDLRSHLVMLNKQLNQTVSWSFPHYILLNILFTYTFSCLKNAAGGGCES